MEDAQDQIIAVATMDGQELDALLVLPHSIIVMHRYNCNEKNYNY